MPEPGAHLQKCLGRWATWLLTRSRHCQARIEYLFCFLMICISFSVLLCAYLCFLSILLLGYNTLLYFMKILP